MKKNHTHKDLQECNTQSLCKNVNSQKLKQPQSQEISDTQAARVENFADARFAN